MFPVAALANLKPAEVVAVIKQMAHADFAGKCWASHETLATGTMMSASAMQRAIQKLAAGKHVTVRRRFAQTNVYTLAEPFRRPKPTSAPQLPENGKEKEKQRKIEVEDSKREVGPVRLAPPEKPAGKRASGPNPFARRQWLRRLNTYVSERLHGPQQWSGWEVIAKAETGLLDPTEQRLLDGLDRLMRA
jgi:hypothetical protein